MYLIKTENTRFYNFWTPLSDEIWNTPVIPKRPAQITVKSKYTYSTYS